SDLLSDESLLYGAALELFLILLLIQQFPLLSLYHAINDALPPHPYLHGKCFRIFDKIDGILFQTAIVSSQAVYLRSLSQHKQRNIKFLLMHVETYPEEAPSGAGFLSNTQYAIQEQLIPSAPFSPDVL